MQSTDDASSSGEELGFPSDYNSLPSSWEYDGGDSLERENDDITFPDWQLSPSSPKNVSPSSSLLEVDNKGA